jgi:hypothetical protein
MKKQWSSSSASPGLRDYGTMHVRNSDYRWLALLVPYAGSDSM